MDEILRLIKEKLMLTNQLVEAAEAQRSALKENLNGRPRGTWKRFCGAWKTRNGIPPIS